MHFKIYCVFSCSTIAQDILHPLLHSTCVDQASQMEQHLGEQKGRLLQVYDETESEVERSLIFHVIARDLR